jgi:hypothetical protein
MYQLEVNRLGLQIDITLLLVSATILAASALISKDYQVQLNDQHLKILEKLILCTNLLCILLLGVSLFGYVNHAQTLRNNLAKRAAYLIDHPDEPGSSVEIASSPNQNWFLTCEKAAYISFVLFIIELTAMGLLK